MDAAGSQNLVQFLLLSGCCVWTLPAEFSFATIIFDSFSWNGKLHFTSVHRKSLFSSRLCPFLFPLLFSEAAAPSLVLLPFPPQKAAKHELDLSRRNTTFGTALTPVARAIKLDLLTPSSCITPNIDLWPLRSCTLNRVPALPLHAFHRNTKHTSCFTSLSVPYNLKRVLVSSQDDSFTDSKWTWLPMMLRSGQVFSLSVYTHVFGKETQRMLTC